MKINLDNMSGMRDLDISLVGTGRIAWELEKDPLRYKPATHIGAVNYLIRKGAKLHWKMLYDPQQPKAQAAAEFIRSGTKQNVEIAQTPDDILKQRPDILVIASTTDSHFSWLTRAIEAQVPVIVAEKPVATIQEELETLAQLDKNSASSIIVNYERRFHPKYSELRKQILKGEFGQVLHYRGLFSSTGKNLFPDSHSEGILLRDTTHLLDLAMFLFGPATDSKTQHAEKNVLAWFIHESGVSGNITTLSHSSFFHFELEIITQKARIRVGNGFYSIERSGPSNLYKNFFSLSAPRYLTDKALKPKKNPFIRMYLRAINGTASPELFSQAIQNAALLLKK